MRNREIDRDIAEAKQNIDDLLTRRAIRAMDNAKPANATFRLRESIAEAITAGRTPRLADVLKLESAEPQSQVAARHLSRRPPRSLRRA